MTPSVTGADTRERILAAAVRRIASEGIDGVRIARIAMDAGVSSSLVHYHFDTREELLAQALAWSYEHVGTQRAEMEQDADASHAQRLGRIVDQCLPLTAELREDWVLWMELSLCDGLGVRHVIGDQTITLEVARAIVTASLARDLGIEQHQLDTMVSVP